MFYVRLDKKKSLFYIEEQNEGVKEKSNEKERFYKRKERDKKEVERLII